MTRLFISHAAKDKPVVNAFFDLLQTGINVDPNVTFCSSLEGMGIPGGMNFVQYIKEQIQEPDLILLMLSPNYMESMFCLCELGAGWAMSHNMIPIIFGDLRFADLKAVLTGTHAFRLENDNDLTEFRDQVIPILGLNAPATARWNIKKDAFLNDLQQILNDIEPPNIVTFAEHTKLKGEYDGAVEELRKLDEENTELQKQMEVLRNCKDREEVAEVERKFSGDWEVFDRLCEEARDCLKQLPVVVRKTIYHDMNGKEFIPDDQSYEWDQVRQAENNDYLSVSDDNIYLIHDDPTVGSAVLSLTAVQKFLEKDSPYDDVNADFFQQYEERYGHRPVFTSQKVWEQNLGLTDRRLFLR